MSTPFYDLASLVVVPSGYKASKVYAQKPLTTDGQLAFSRASTATRVNASGLIETVSSNVPRLDYTNSTCPKLLLEPQRTNLVIYSSDFTDASWGKAVAGSSSVTVTGNNTTAPDGTNTADLISLSRSATSEIAALFRGTSTGTGTFKGSIWLKAKGTSDVGKTIDLWSWEGTTRGYTKVTLTANWVRYEQDTTVFTGTGSELFDFGLLPAAYSTSTTLNVEFYAWGAQSEAGAYSTSLIPTTSSTVTRLADACSKTGISSLIGQTEGTLFVDLSEVNDLDFPEITIDNNNNTDRIVITRSSAGNWGIFVASTAAATYSVYSTTSSANGKFALAYSSAGYALYRNGVQIVTGTYNLPAALSAIRFNGRSTSDFYSTKKVAQALLFKTRLTNAQLAELTTL